MGLKKTWFSLANKLTILMTLSTLIILLGFFSYIYPSFKILTEQSYRAQLLQKTLQEKKLVATLGPVAAPFDRDISIICIKKVIGGMIILILITSIANYLIAARTMQKVKSLGSLMQEIDASELTTRLNSNEWPIELRQVVVPFNHMLQRLELAFTTLSQFSSDLAHEIRTPLHNLKSITEITLSKARTGQEYQQRLGEFADELTKMQQLTESLLFLARIENHQEAIHVQAQSLAQLIEKVLDFFSASIADKEIQVSCIGDATVMIDALLFERVISNLLSNALRHTPRHGTIQFTISTHPNSIKLQIQDSGPGIAANHLPHIFKRFYRADYARSQEMGGNGLGLAISQAIVELHQGHISVSSLHGVGACFTIEFLK